MFLKEAVITTLGISRNVYQQNIKRLHNTAIAVITIAISMMNHTDRDKMNPNNDRNDHISINSRKPNDEYDYSYWSHPPRRSSYLQRLVRPTATSFRQIYAKTEYTTETAEHKTVNRKATNDNEVLTVI